MTTKKDFLNALKNPTHTAVKLRLRTLRKELKEINWKLQYMYHKKSQTFYMKLTPNALSTATQAMIMRLLVPLNEVNNSHLYDSYNERSGEMYVDIWIGSDGGFIV